MNSPCSILVFLLLLGVPQLVMGQDIGSVRAGRKNFGIFGGHPLGTVNFSSKQALLPSVSSEAPYPWRDGILLRLYSLLGRNILTGLDVVARGTMSFLHQMAGNNEQRYSCSTWVVSPTVHYLETRNSVQSAAKSLSQLVGGSIGSLVSSMLYAFLTPCAFSTTENNGPTKVKQGRSEGAAEVVISRRELLMGGKNRIRERILNLIDSQVIGCGTNLPKALDQTGVLLILACAWQMLGVQTHLLVLADQIPDKQLEAARPKHIAKWEAGTDSSNDVPSEQERTSSGTQCTTNSQKDSAHLTQRGISQFKVKPASPLYPFLTIAYFRALRVLEAARDLHIFHMLSIHIARQALYLVILLNDSLDREKGLTQEQEDERINLEDELMNLEDAISKWACIQFQSKEDLMSLIAEIKQQYEQFFKARFYFNDARNPDQDTIYVKLLYYDQKTFKRKHWQLGLFNDDDERSNGSIGNIHTSPTISRREVPKEGGRTAPLGPVSPNMTGARLPNGPVVIHDKRLD